MNASMENHQSREAIYKLLPTTEAIAFIYNEEVFSPKNISFVRRTIDEMSLEPHDMILAVNIIVKHEEEMKKERTQAFGKVVHYFGTPNDYFEKGSIKSIGTLKNGKLCGNHSFYFKDHPQNKIQVKTFYRNGKKNGKRTVYDTDGGKLYSCLFQNDFLHGRYETYFEENNKSKSVLKTIHSFKNGFLDGFCKHFYPNGKLKAQCFFSKNLLCGTLKEYQGSTNLPIKEEKYHNGHLHGPQHYYSSSIPFRRELIKKVSYWMGKKHGRETIYHSFETEIISWKYGEKHGVSKILQKNKTKPSYQVSYMNGKKHGFEKKYENGVLKESIKWINGFLASDVMKKKFEMSFMIYLETNLLKHTVKIPKKFLIEYCQEKNLNPGKRVTKIELLKVLSKNHKANKELTIEEDNIDLFGYEVQNPVIGSDGGIYDLESMKILFDKNDKGEYKNIKNCYEGNSLVPNYPRGHNGNILKNFYTMQDLKKNSNIENAKELMQSLYQFIQKTEKC